MEDEVQQIEPIEEPGAVATAQPIAELRLLRGGTPSGDSFPLAEKNVIGRFDATVGPVDIDLGPLPEGTYISRKHAEIWHEDDAWMLKDLGSSNGTFVMEDGDFKRIEADTEIHDSQEIAFGNARFSFHVNIEPVVVPETDETA